MSSIYILDDDRFSEELQSWQLTRNKNKKTGEKHTHINYPQNGGVGGGGGWGIYILKNTIILVDQLYASLQIIIHSLLTVYNMENKFWTI